MYKIEIGRKQLLVIVICASLLVTLLFWGIVQPAAAHDAYRPAYLTTFGETYASSTSNDAGCQLCHQNPGGGDGWNAYGWSIRQQILDDSGPTITQVLTSIETVDADGNGVSNLDEINNNAQPGWTAGDANTIFFSDGTTLTDQAPPDGVSAVDVDATYVSLRNQQVATATALPLIGLLMLIAVSAVGIKQTRR